MKLVVFSDIHGNYDALDRFFEEIDALEYNYLIFCGDIFGYYYDQKRIMEKLLSTKNLIWILGNHDKYVCDIISKKLDASSYIARYGHSYDGLSYFNKDYIRELQKKKSFYILNDGEKKIGIFHGTPENSLEGRLYPDNEIDVEEEYNKYDIVLLGHTHCRMMRMINKTLVINSGSLGQPRDGNEFGYAIVNTKTNEVEFCDIKINTVEIYKQIDRYDPDLMKLKEVLERRGKNAKNTGDSN